ncbi:MAG: dTDP-4-dehydrorhamnose 3,5-epimerase [Bacteroidales bacterium]|nr:dTDP-4-dehydrorhamnose 3,5-epimerase [Bacteroidales bacterium]
MNVIQTDFKGLVIIEPEVFSDPRGYFYESYNQRRFCDSSLDYVFVQDNQSKSVYGVIRGLHYQILPYAQTKLIRVLQGKILDIAVDIRKGSPTYAKWYGIELSEENHLQLLIPKGFAHGFSVLSSTAVIMYKCDNFYVPAADRGIIYNDTHLNIDWKIDTDKILVSDKDRKLPALNDAEMNFKYHSE